MPSSTEGNGGAEPGDPGAHDDDIHGDRLRVAQMKRMVKCMQGGMAGMSMQCFMPHLYRMQGCMRKITTSDLCMITNCILLLRTT